MQKAIVTRRPNRHRINKTPATGAAMLQKGKRAKQKTIGTGKRANTDRKQLTVLKTAAKHNISPTENNRQHTKHQKHMSDVSNPLLFIIFTLPPLFFAIFFTYTTQQKPRTLTT